MWPLWTGPLIAIGPFIAIIVLFVLFLPCIVLQGARTRRRQRSIVQMEEGRRANQLYIDAANAEAVRLAAARAAPEQVAQPEEPRQRDGTGEDAKASPPEIEAKGEGTSPSDHNLSKDVPPSGNVADPEMIETPTATPENDVASAISPPPPAHLSH